LQGIREKRFPRLMTINAGAGLSKRLIVEAARENPIAKIAKTHRAKLFDIIKSSLTTLQIAAF
jgi:hypothetical protein